MPTGIKILAVLNVFGALLALVPIRRLFALSHPLAPVAGVLLLVFVGAGLVFTAISVVLDLVTADLLGLIVSAAIVYYLFENEDLYRQNGRAYG